MHERSIDSDFLLIILRDLIQSDRPDLRVVLMSATLNADTFAAFFQTAGFAPPPNVHIPGFTFPVEDFFFEDAVELTGILPKDVVHIKSYRKGGHHHRRHQADSGASSAEEYRETIDALTKQGYSPNSAEAVATFDEKEIPLGLITALVDHIRSGPQEGAILIFLPGWDDISKCHDALNELEGSAGSLLLYPLHGGMPTAQQRGIFDPAPRGLRKVVIATNIAESSITIDDVVFVIDSGKHKEKTYDAESRIACLMPTWVSKASAHQRRGRAGRVRAGKCWHLFPLKKLEELNEYQLPEIVRTPLEQLCLQVRGLKLAAKGPGGIEGFLGKAISPPSARTLANALDSLHRTQALRVEDEELTTLGHLLATLPMDPRIGKALVRHYPTSISLH